MRLGLKVRSDPFKQSNPAEMLLTTAPVSVEQLQSVKQMMRDLTPFELTHQQLMRGGQMTLKANQTTLKEDH